MPLTQNPQRPSMKSVRDGNATGNSNGTSSSNPNWGTTLYAGLPKDLREKFEAYKSFNDPSSSSRVQSGLGLAGPDSRSPTLELLSSFPFLFTQPTSYISPSPSNPNPNPNPNPPFNPTSNQRSALSLTLSERIENKQILLRNDGGKSDKTLKDERKKRDESDKKKKAKEVKGEIGGKGKHPRLGVDKRKRTRKAKRDRREERKGGDGLNYNTLIPLHHLWLSYMSELLDLPVLVPKNSTSKPSNSRSNKSTMFNSEPSSTKPTGDANAEDHEMETNEDETTTNSKTEGKRRRQSLVPTSITTSSTAILAQSPIGRFTDQVKGGQNDSTDKSKGKGKAKDDGMNIDRDQPIRTPGADDDPLERKLGTANVQSMQIKLLKADWRGCGMGVKFAKNKSLEGIHGLVIDETEGTFKFITRKNEVKVIPKHNSIFTFSLPLVSPPPKISHPPPTTSEPVEPNIPMELDGSINEMNVEGGNTPATSKTKKTELRSISFDIHGSNYCFRAVDRAGRKWKAPIGAGGWDL